MGLFSNLFGKRAPEMGPADLSVLKCDVHSHFIPGIDDGAQTVEQSVELISAMHELGFTKVITTPHVMADGYRNTPEIILGGLDTVRRELHVKGVPVEIEAAAEYYLDHELDRLVKEKNVLTFGDRMLLFELPFLSEPVMLLSMVFEMQTAGYKPVLAHPERYAFWHEGSDMPDKLKERGVLFQLNTIALGGHYGPQVRKAAERYIDQGWYELVGSDCHRMDHVMAIRDTLTSPHLHALIGSGKLRNAAL
jgi:tyrosine-protein phosphatase YwqE